MTFTVNDTVWKLRLVNPRDKNLRRSDGSPCLGLCDNNLKTVFIADNQPPDKEEHILCHELCHCICFEYGFLLDVELEEWLCNFMADYGKEIIYLVDDLLWNIRKAYIA